MAKQNRWLKRLIVYVERRKLNFFARMEENESYEENSTRQSENRIEDWKRFDAVTIYGIVYLVDFQ